MAFLFKSKKNQEREKDRVLSSRDGPPVTSSQQSSIASNASRLARDEKTAMQRSTPTGSLNSLENDGTSSPDQVSYGRRAEQVTSQQSGDLQYRNGPGPTLGNSNMSLYPWSQRRLTYTTSTISPFPRYGAAVNATGSKEGDIYVMGGLINSQNVKGDLWMVEAGANMSCYELPTTAEGPSPRVGHASLLVGNAFIVYGGDTKIEENDILDETLYLLNTSTRQWSRALPSGPRPSGRYGHSLNILGSKIYIFGGQVEGYFMNDLAAFDLNQLQMPNNRWEILIPNSDNGGPPVGKIPPARTNHSVVSYNDKMYLFGGTNGFQWFNDVWCYDPATNSWTQQDCIGYIPVQREGHAAALVDDVMYIFGGRTEEGADLGDLAAFRITSRRWYTFQNMGPSPSPRSGHSMTSVGKSIVVLGGEPSSATTTVNDLALAYMLDTNKIRYPNDAQIAAGQKNTTQQGTRRPSDAARQVASRDGSQGPRDDRKRSMVPGTVNSPTNGFRSPNGNDVNAPSPVNGGSRLPRAAGPSPPAGPPPQGQPPKPSQAARDRNAPSDRGGELASSPVLNNATKNQSPVSRDPPKEIDSPTGLGGGARQGPGPTAQLGPRGPLPDPIRQPLRRRLPHQPRLAHPRLRQLLSRLRLVRQRLLLWLMALPQPQGRSNRANAARAPLMPRQKEQAPAQAAARHHRRLRPEQDNRAATSLRGELDSARNRNAWYASELELARKSGYTPNATLSPVLDSRSAETFTEDDRPLIEALLAMRAELANVQSSVDKQAVLAAKQIAEAEKQRDAAIQEAVYAKAKLAAHFGNNSASSTPQLGGDRDADSRVEESNRKLATALSQQKDLQSQLERLTVEVDAEKRARQLADDTLNAAQRRMTDLETYKQQTSYELERLKAELHNAQREAREHSVAAAEAVSTAQLLRVDKESFERQYNDAVGSAKDTGDSFASLRAALAASDEIRSHLEETLQQERAQRETVESKLASIKAELEARTAEALSTSQRLRDAEELAEKHANEARTHRQAVLNGLDAINARSVGTPNKADGERLVALQAQLVTANALVKKHQQDADTAAERLRSAEERIAGLEAYQEQSSREGVTIRRQLQAAMRDTQTLQAQNTDLKNQLSNQQLETNAVMVQHNTLKDILSERGISPTSSPRARGSPGEMSPEHETRIRSLEQQLASAVASHEETKQMFAVQASDSEAVYRDKLTQLENDYQSAVHYVKGTEKMLKQLKEQLARYKAENSRLKTEVEELETKTAGTRNLAASAPPEWEAERGHLSQKVEALQGDLASSKAQLEAQLQSVQQELEQVKSEREAAQKSKDEAMSHLTSSRRDLEQLHQENALLEQRAQEAEQKVGLLLDQVESSVGNYRRRSRQVASINAEQLREAAASGPNAATIPTTNGHNGGIGNHTTIPALKIGGSGLGHERQDSSETGSAYGESVGGDARNSAALDSLANELETLRSHWEATNKNYRLSNAFDFESTPGAGAGGAGAGAAPPSLSTGLRKDNKDEGGLGLSESLADWRKRLDS
ncbi:cell polarity protein (Tea1) [Sporothrix brasiliensis 5110]|uniref:Cell polarity protein (Tea1) n=1 Tax=Sporothrix brasiliensis 5110 TaxID=1398154 RepID=A0A0C2FKJ5_9PEZI|nr:cell polarity protein (Tea1) [Sporothrix brasiliensis 5110]KIH91608.1 cell polarity protein (Tea1) [Sporothrix brasiliensis 5110]